VRHGLVAAAALGVALAAGTAEAQRIPLRKGVMLNYAMKDTWFDKDVEQMLQIVDVAGGAVTLRELLADPDTGAKFKHRADPDDLVSPGELLGAHNITTGASQGDTAGIRPRTVMMASRRIWQRLKQDGRAEVRMFSFQNGERFMEMGYLTVTRREPQMISVLIDGVPRDLPTILAEGTLANPLSGIALPTKVWFLDDSAGAWLVRSERFFPKGRSYHAVLASVVTHTDSSAATLEASLRKECRASVYGVYFPFGKATVEPASAATLDEVAAILRKNPDWALTVEGHTDSIGNPAANKALSERRAAAVRAELVERHGIAAGRLTSAGYGSAKPVAGNATLEGRARNRRVDLVRKC
jgi:flagellar motor protein MotB